MKSGLGPKMAFLWSPKHEDELVKWLSEYFEKPVETFAQMSSDQIWAVYKRICPFDPPLGKWISTDYH